MKINDKNIVLGILLGFCIVLVFVSTRQYSQNKDLEKKLQDSKVEAPEIYHYLNSLTIPNFEKKVSDKEDFIAYVGRPNCGDCQLFEPQFITLINDYDTDNMWYINVKKLREDNLEKWAVFKEQYGFTQTPAIIHFSNGSIQDMIEWQDNKGLPLTDLKKWLIKNF